MEVSSETSGTAVGKFGSCACYQAASYMPISRDPANRVT